MGSETAVQPVQKQDRSGWAKSTSEWIHRVIDDKQYAKEYRAKKMMLPHGALIDYPDKYKPEYAVTALEVMRKAKSSIARLAVELKCSKTVLHVWMKRHPTFRNAVEEGRQESEAKFLEAVADHAFESTNKVNNGLIKALAKNIHGIDFDDAPQIVINNTNQTQVNNKEESANLYKEALYELN